MVLMAMTVVVVMVVVEMMMVMVIFQSRSSNCHFLHSINESSP